VPPALIAETIQVIAVLAPAGSDRRLSELAQVEGLDRPATMSFTRQEIGYDTNTFPHLP